MRRNIRSLCTALEKDEPLTLEKWILKNSPSDERVRLVMEQSCAIDGNEQSPEKWVSQDDIGERAEPRQLMALFDGLSEKLEGPRGKVIVRQPNKRMKKNSKNPFWIEHYYPQKPVRWDDDLGAWNVNPESMENRLNALGNLSVLNNFGNVKMSNKALADKQQDYKEAQVPSFKLNHDFMSAERWTPVQIDARTKELVAAALEFWSLPSQ
jgi:hypothetical protein